ncbi:chitinase [Ranunculus cassubicifolius]
MEFLHKPHNPFTFIIKQPPNSFSPYKLTQLSHSPSTPTKIHAGLRGGPRKPLWRSRVLSTEAIQVVQSLKLAKTNPNNLTNVFNNKLTRLLKTDLLDTLAELKRQNEYQLAHKVFDYMRKEIWYKPELGLYCDMICMLGRNKMVGNVEEMFGQLIKEGLVPDVRTYSEMIGVYVRVEMVEKAMEMYGLMKEAGCEPDKLTLTILIRGLEKVGEEELVMVVKQDCLKYVEFPEKFIEEVGKKYPRRKSVGLV